MKQRNLKVIRHGKLTLFEQKYARWYEAVKRIYPQINFSLYEGKRDGIAEAVEDFVDSLTMENVFAMLGIKSHAGALKALEEGRGLNEDTDNVAGTVYDDYEDLRDMLALYLIEYRFRVTNEMYDLDWKAYAQILVNDYYKGGKTFPENLTSVEERLEYMVFEEKFPLANGKQPFINYEECMAAISNEDGQKYLSSILGKLSEKYSDPKTYEDAKFICRHILWRHILGTLGYYDDLYDGWDDPKLTWCD